MRAVITEALYTLQNKKPAAQGGAMRSLPPFMSSDKMLSVWRAAQDAWMQDSDALVREIEKEREEWDQRIDSM